MELWVDAAVGNDVIKHAIHCFGWAPRVPFLLSLLSLAVNGRVGVICFVLGGEPQVRTKGTIVPRSVCMATHPRGSYVVHPLLTIEASIPGLF